MKFTALEKAEVSSVARDEAVEKMGTAAVCADSRDEVWLKKQTTNNYIVEKPKAKKLTVMFPRVRKALDPSEPVLPGSRGSRRPHSMRKGKNLQVRQVLSMRKLQKNF